MKYNHKIPFYLAIFVSLAILTACSNSKVDEPETKNLPAENVNETQENTETNTDEATSEQNAVLTMDTAKWKEEKSLPGVTFSYPPELQYEVGGGTEGWEKSYVSLNTTAEPYFTFTKMSLLKCKFEDPTQCDVGTQIQATPEEVFQGLLKSYTKIDALKVGNAEGIEFTDPNNSSDESLNKLLFKSTKGVFILSAGKNTDPKLFEAFLKTFKVE